MKESARAPIAGSTRRVKRAPGSKSAMLCATLASWLVFGLAHAQQGDLDFYAPREGADAQLFRNVEGYHLEPGRQDLANRNYRGALANSEFILDMYPNHPRALDLISQVCTAWKSPRCDADARFERAVARNPNAATTYIVLGFHYHRNGKVEQAIASYKHALELEPGSLNAYYNLGLAYVAQKQYALGNEAAQHAYALGAQLPGLRDKLKAVGAWQPIDAAAQPSRGDALSSSPRGPASN